jgi:F-box-like
MLYLLPPILITRRHSHCRRHEAHTGCREGPSQTAVRITLGHAFQTSSGFFGRPINFNNYQVSPTAGTTIRDLPTEVLLEIFDSYRQAFQHERLYERVWSSNMGWFKLVHVCRDWRQVVLASPARLQARILFTPHRTRKAITGNFSPLLPIAVDYRSTPAKSMWSTKILYRVISALAYPDRVCWIAISLPSEIVRNWNMTILNMKLLAAVNQPFPALESLELDCKGIQSMRSLYPPPFLSAQTPHLRRLKFIGNTSTLLSDILSRTTSLVDLTLCITRVFFKPSGTQLLVYLQDMPFLRPLELEMWSNHRLTPPDLPGSDGTKDILLSKLTSFCFTGSTTQLGALMTGLTTPSLTELRIAHPSLFPFSMAHTIHLSRFLHTTGKQLFSAKLNVSSGGISLSMRTDPHLDDDPPFNIIASSISSIQSIGDMFSATLVTV